MFIDKHKYIHSEHYILLVFSCLIFATTKSRNWNQLIFSRKWIGKEVITRYKTQLLTASEWYTDSNGRRLIRRVRNQRKTWNLTVTEPVAGNYYPITSAAIVLGNKHQVTVITDRPQGASSMVDGELEIMVSLRTCSTSFVQLCVMSL